MRMLRRPYRCEAACFERLSKFTGRDRVIGEEHSRTEMHALPPVCGAANRPKPCLGETDLDGFGAFAALGNVDKDALTLIEGADPGSLEHRRVNESVLSAVVANDEAEALLGIKPLYSAGFFDGRLGGGHSTAGRR